MNRIPSGDAVVFRPLASGRIQHRQIRMELVDKGTIVLIGDRLYSVRKLFQRLVVTRQRRRSLFIVIQRLWCHPSGTNVGLFGFLRHPQQPLHVRLEGMLGKISITTIIHPKIDRHRGGFVQQHITLKSGVTTHRSISSNTDVAERDLPMWKTANSPHFNIV